MKPPVFTDQPNSHFITFNCKGRRNLLVTPRAKQIVIHVLCGLVTRDRVHVSGFVIMPDHVHALLWLEDDREVSKVIQAWKSLSSRYLKVYYDEARPDLLEFLKHEKDHREVISFWERKYYNFDLYTPQKLREKLNYMHENPVRKGLAVTAQDYKWSSAPWYYLQRSVGVRIDPGL